MKKRIAFTVTTLLLMMSLLSVSVFAAGGFASSLLGSQDTEFNSKAWLYQRADGGLTRVEDYREIEPTTLNEVHKLIVEDYNTSLQVQNFLQLDFELPLFGGFYAGKTYNYLIFGQENRNEDDNCEVIRVVKYSKGWTRLGSASIYGANTTVPFSFGTARCTESGDTLYVHTCHEMYQSNDGQNHQANMAFSIKQSTMTVTGNRSAVGFSGFGYVSHSLNQFILVDNNGKLATLDEGDAYPRAACINRFSVPAEPAGDDEDSSAITSSAVQTNVLTFEGDIGENATGCTIGGFSCSDENYLAAFAYTPNRLSNSQANIYVTYTDCNTMQNGAVLQLSHYTDGTTVSTPKLVKFSDDRFLVMWMPHVAGTHPYNDALTCYTFVDGSGHQLSDVKTINARLSACQPVVVGSSAIWYSTGVMGEMSQWGQYVDNSAPIFYAIDVNGNQIAAETAAQHPYPIVGGFSDVYENQYFAEPVQWAVENSVTAGTSATTFSPEDTCTQAQILTFLYRAVGTPAVGADNPYSDKAMTPDQYFYQALLWAYDKEIVTDAALSPSAPCKRADVVTYLWRLAGSPDASAADFTDVPATEKYATAVAWAVQKGVTAGTSTTTFSPDDTCTRGQIATFLWRNQTK